ncbi:flagellar biosynthesis protein FlgN [Novosphingobium guangzhouense]|uniref:Flagellar biosynthesis protein FlgN n=1 Tax=Novosphingobium guangzhouense TaxID=1850347 RepID=A0A2K2FVB5_9SPHN|nr:flagellar biosynthesis protein FlgN [Novosphingobium guangzhouense]PNU02735.1 flagellar biosynthesis protein FlgN [Novosphingobium guangzhouense]
MANETDTTGAGGIIEVMTSLSSIMREETRALEGGTRALDLAELASAKARLVGTLEERLARAGRQEPGWTAQLDAATRESFTQALGELRAASMVNAALLERHIELSADLMGAISSEAKRATGNRAYTYGATGNLARADLTTPISLNGEF